MIKITHLDNQESMLNAELIEAVDATPDTLITLITGRKLMVKESVDEVVAAIKKYKKDIFSAFLDDVKHGK